MARKMSKKRKIKDVGMSTLKRRRKEGENMICKKH